MFRQLIAAAFVACFLAAALLACKGGSDRTDQGPEREIPPETKGAELKDSTRLDPAETGSGPYDTTFHDSGRVTEQ